MIIGQPTVLEFQQYLKIERSQQKNSSDGSQSNDRLLI